MTNKYKYILLYIVFLASLVAIFYLIDDSKERNIKHQQRILLQQAQSHFQSQSSTRKWNDEYLGVYVRSKKELKPHPYLPYNTIYTEDNETLFRVNHASMARQLSEMSDQKDLQFHLTSLNPLNPKNKAGEFELRALKSIEENNKTEYYEFNPYHFRYLGAILTEKKCMECHANYEVGDIRGGLSVTLDSKNYNDAISEIETRSNVLKIGFFIFFIFYYIFNDSTNSIKSNFSDTSPKKNKTDK
jgi:hypothetical protein